MSVAWPLAAPQPLYSTSICSYIPRIVRHSSQQPDLAPSTNQEMATCYCLLRTALFISLGLSPVNTQGPSSQRAPLFLRMARAQIYILDKASWACSWVLSLMNFRSELAIPPTTAACLEISCWLSLKAAFLVIFGVVSICRIYRSPVSSPLTLRNIHRN